MTAILLWKQKIKEFYGEHDTWILPVLKFFLSLLLFTEINRTMGFMDRLNNIFVVLILSLLCSVLPVNTMTVIGCLFILGHCYAVGVETAGFAFVLLMLLVILFLRFTSRDNVALIMTPVAFTFRLPAVVPISSGLLRGPACSIPAGCGVILYSFMKLVKDRAAVLQGTETEALQKLQLLLDGMIKNQEMWLTIIVFAAVTIVVHLIRSSSFDYSWRIAIVTGAVVYVVLMVFGSMFMSVSMELNAIIISGIFSVLIGFVLEFFVLGVDYSRSEVTQFEDDEYVYYVKAVPKSLVSETRKSVKKFSPTTENRKETADEETISKTVDISGQMEELDISDVAPVEHVSQEDFDFEKQLEESLKNL
ncbi:MAG: hypothetical protein ACI4EO_05110 [Blautia sp.]